MTTKTLPAPVDALEERWRWLSQQASLDVVSRRQTLEMLEDAAAAEARVRQDYTGRYPLELLQNAHDACADAGHVGSVHFVVTPTALLVANQGVPFTYDRIKSLTRLGASEKLANRNGRNLIGYKGIGFSSVFEISERPQVIGKAMAFGFDPDLAKDRVSEGLGSAKRLPIRSFAHQIRPSEWASDRSRVGRLLDGGAVTVVRLPLLPSVSSDEIAEALRETITPEALLFMPAVREIRMSGPDLRFAWSRHRGRRTGKGVLVALRAPGGAQRSWLLHRSTVPVQRGVVEAVSDQLRDDSWRSVRRLNVAVALPWRRGKVDPGVGSQRLHVYFPTDDDLGRAVLVHGDFYVQSSRRRIESRGPGGTISERVAEEAARLTAELASSVARQGNPLLRALAPTGDDDGFGHTMAGLIDERLAETRFVRAASGALKKPEDISRLGTELGGRDEEALSRLAGSRPDVLWPGDDAGEAVDLLDQLAVEALDPDDLAKLLDGSRSDLTYGQLAGVLVRWLSSLTSWEQSFTIDELQKRPILQDAHGKWARPDELVVRADDTVQMPKGLERREASRPRGRFGKRLIELLDVAVLDSLNAVETVISAVTAGGFGTSGSGARDVLRFLTDVWEKAPERLEAMHDRLGVIHVPTKPAQQGIGGWSRADETYFSAPWIGNRALEVLYGSYGFSEFLAAPVPRDPRKRTARRRFFTTLGVAEAPRLEGFSRSAWRPGYWIRLEGGDYPERSRDWQDIAEFERFACPAGHPESLRLSGALVDRLDELLIDDVSLRRADALAVALSRLDDPYGPRAEIRCRHSAHPGRLIKRVPGYQRWLLENTDWVPVTGDPAGAKFRKPGDAWIDISPRDSWLALPRVRLPKEARAKFAFSSAQRPRVDSLERALDYLAEAYEEPERAGEVILRTAMWLQERLDRALLSGRDSAKSPQERRDRALRRIAEAAADPTLLCTSGGKWQWHANPLVADVPGIESFDRLALLPPGVWRGLRDEYGLKRASEAVQIRVRAGKTVRGTGLLDYESRVQLLAVLVNYGIEPAQVARRLAMIRTLPVAALSIELSLDGESSDARRSFHLEVGRTPRRISSARLHYVPADPINMTALGRDVAALLDQPDLASIIALVLHDPEDVLSAEAVSEHQLTEARRLLDGARRRARIPEESDEIPPVEDDGDVEESPSGRRRAASPSGDGHQPVAPDQEAFSTDRDTRPAQLVSESVSFSTVKAGRRRERRQRAPRPPRLTGTAGAGAAGEADQEVERRAMQIVSRYGCEVLGADVFDVHGEKKGWDLEFRLPDGTWELVEVKGTSGDASFVLTRNERRAASDEETGPRYTLYWVANAADPRRAEIRRFSEIGLHLTEDVLDPLSWEAWDWSALPHQVIALRGEA